MKRFTVARNAALAVVAIAWSWGCEKPPLDQMTSVQSAVEKARAAEAATYASAELARLNDSLQSAQAEVKRQSDRFIPSYKQAKATLTWVDTYSAQVIETARKNKERMRQETTALVQSAAADVDSAAALVAAAPKGKGTKEDIELIQNQVNELRAQVDAARQHLTAERFTEAQAAAKSVKQEASGVMNEVKAVIERYEQLKGKGRGRAR